MSLMPDENEGSAAPPQDPGDTAEVNEDTRDSNNSDIAMTEVGGNGASEDRMLEYLQEAREEEGGEGMAGQPMNGSAFRKFKAMEEAHEVDVLSNTNRSPSSAGSYSTPDDTPSLHGSVTSSSFAGSALGSRFSPSPSLRPFDRRFQSRLHPSNPGNLLTPRALSPSLLGVHSRESSVGSKAEDIGIEGLDDHSAPWDIVRLTKLKKISAQLFSEAGKRSFGTPTCITVSATIAVGTTKGIILVFDYPQSLKSIIGHGTKAIECGAITALAVSADHTTIAGGHANGHIFTWELAKPSSPFLRIPPLAPYQMEDRKEDGHVEGVSVLHLGFLGIRHTALTSADDKGMAFSHLATRGLGAIGRTVKTARILGRYPVNTAPTNRPRKPSSVLGLSVLPLGNSPERTDSMGLVAMLTPYLLVIVSTTPIAQTQHKAVRPKETASDSALSGCLAWYPAVKLKHAPSGASSKPTSSKARLAYAWSNVLTLLELSTIEAEGLEDPNRPPTLEFRVQSRYRCEEAIVAVQWFNRQIIGVLTVTQRLIILEDVPLRVTETFDLMPKRILHRNVFGDHLHPLVNRMDEEGSIHPHVADAFYNSFRTYKGRVFILCQHEMSVGTLSNWADRLLAMMEVGDFIGAICLATSYYVGKSNKLTIGLPEDPLLRHPMVEEKLLEMMAASLRYAFGKNQSSPRKEILGKEQLQELATACFDACLSMDRTDFLFDEAFEYFEQGGVVGIFLETLEPHILDCMISFIPPIVVKALIIHYASQEQESRLEEMICHMDTRTLDIDQVTTLCKQHQLYDAMIYVWNRALNDYITPMIDLLTLLVPQIQSGMHENGDSVHAINALKIFPYLSYILTGRVYPTGEDLTEPEASNAKAQIYYFLFLGQAITWPKGGKPFLTKQNSEPQSSFPYLRLILQYDAPSFLSALNEAFEDSFLTGATDTLQLLNGGKQDFGEDQVFGRSVNRQYIVHILLEVMNSTDFPPQDTIYLDMFIARNFPKFLQFILLPGSALHRVLVGLCNPPGDDIADDCQLSVEYLLTVYRPPDIDSLVGLFTNAGFFRVLKSIFRSDKQYSKLLRVYFDDEEALEAVFDCIADCLRPRSGLNEKQREEVKTVIKQNARKLINIGEVRTARIIHSYAPDLHDAMLSAIEDSPEYQFSYLRTILEPSNEHERPEMGKPAIMQNKDFVETYVCLMCEFDPEHVSQFVGGLQSGDLRLEEVLPAMESNGVMDAAVKLMAREGQIRQAMDRLLSHLGTLETAFVAVLKASPSVEDLEASNNAAVQSLESLQTYAQVGVWLCQGQMKSSLRRLQRPQNHKRRPEKDLLNKEELLWLDLVDTVVRIAKSCISLIHQSIATDPDHPNHLQLDTSKLLVHLRKFVQDTFSALLAATSSNQQTSFLHILRAFLSRASLASPSLADLRNVLGDIFDAYHYEAQLLSLANRLLDKDLFIHVDEAAHLRQRGWKPSSQTCEACGKRIWGPGAAGGIYSAWERTRLENQRRLESLREERRLESDGSLSAVARGKIKARDATTTTTDKTNGEDTGEQQDEEEEKTDDTGELVLFSCRHIFHRKCLDGLQIQREAAAATAVVMMEDEEDGCGFRCVICHGGGNEGVGF
ncbi:Golgi CORVET complex core vacuolar protein 8-domain-containing protein [Trichophaea hybrida]|nr:Golgi CORVET complex core vacuolar protein 8-domain-containing protein [Trichophaea hybrida]